MLKVKTPFPMRYSFALESLYLEFNLLVGFVVGAILAAVLLFRLNKKQTVSDNKKTKKLGK
jgi:uncharacterized membrane protein affecting hemolysin expression